MTWNEVPAAFGAVIEKVALVFPAGIATVGGSTSPVLLPEEAKLTVELPALLESATVQRVVAPGVRVVRAQVNEEIAGEACNVNTAA